MRRLDGDVGVLGQPQRLEPRASASRASSTTSMLTSVANIVIPYRIERVRF